MLIEKTVSSHSIENYPSIKDVGHKKKLGAGGIAFIVGGGTLLVYTFVIMIKGAAVEAEAEEEVAEAEAEAAREEAEVAEEEAEEEAEEPEQVAAAALAALQLLRTHREHTSGSSRPRTSAAATCSCSSGSASATFSKAAKAAAATCSGSSASASASATFCKVAKAAAATCSGSSATCSCSSGSSASATFCKAAKASCAQFRLRTEHYFSGIIPKHFQSIPNLRIWGNKFHTGDNSSTWDFLLETMPVEKSVSSRSSAIQNYPSIKKGPKKKLGAGGIALIVGGGSLLVSCAVLYFVILINGHCVQNLQNLGCNSFYFSLRLTACDPGDYAALGEAANALLALRNQIQGEAAAGNHINSPIQFIKGQEAAVRH
ncbi:hypothetical protein FNV43_RR16267 [Rhamnella rubrinervis]|uniref:Uncharacterized protein n=1 Tax=Rhamnella rubrinervis TaxID=2594499 RepID=A0A8K0E922_9ROSA|nr:hypothetical protein FNV43_RR16267 [Rhamnella rubrinervis]